MTVDNVQVTLRKEETSRPESEQHYRDEETAVDAVYREDEGEQRRLQDAYIGCGAL